MRYLALLLLLIPSIASADLISKVGFRVISSSNSVTCSVGAVTDTYSDTRGRLIPNWHGESSTSRTANIGRKGFYNYSATALEPTAHSVTYGCYITAVVTPANNFWVGQPVAVKVYLNNIENYFMIAPSGTIGLLR